MLSSKELLLQAKALVLCALPYKKHPERSLTRRARVGQDSWLSVTFTAVGETGTAGEVLPYGADRALLGWIQTRAFADGFVRYDSLREFFTDFGLADNGRNYRRFRERVDRLTHLAISIDASDERSEGFKTIVAVPYGWFPKESKEARRRINDEDVGQILMIPERYGFQLSNEFWQYLKNNPIPLPLRLMRRFYSRPKAWDFTQFLLYRCYAAKVSSTIPWPVFLEQFGSQDRDQRRLRATLRQTLKEIKVVYPDLPAELLTGSQGLKVAPWQPTTTA